MQDPSGRGARMTNKLQDFIEAEKRWMPPSQPSKQGPDSYGRDARGIQFMVEAREPLPEVVQARVNNMEDQMYSGFLAELNLAWVSVDDTLCLWLPVPTDGPRPPPCSKLCKDYVLAVALVKPDPRKQYNCDGMPQYFLAVALRESVQIFKLSVTDTEIAIMETGIEIAVESYVKCMLSTPAGRLFVGCNDGCVYELHYHEDDLSLSSFWRPRKFRKTACNSMFSRAELSRRLSSVINLYQTQPVIDLCFDPTRHMLYAMTAQASEQRTTKDKIANNTSLHVYSLTTKDGKGDGSCSPSHLATCNLITFQHILDDDVLDKDVSSIHPVLYSEDDETHLVLVSGSGWRVYLKFDQARASFTVSQLICPPWQSRDPMQLLQHQASISGSTWRARCSTYCNGLFLVGSDAGIHCVAKVRAGGDDDHSHRELVQDIKANQLSQDWRGGSLELWQISELTTPSRISTVRDVWGPSSAASAAQRGCQVPSVNEHWTQHLCPPRRFVCIGAGQVVILHRLQPWEQLRAVCGEYISRWPGRDRAAAAAPASQQQYDQHGLGMSTDNACASLLFWWVRAGGSSAGSRIGDARGGRSSEADDASTFFFQIAKEGESKRNSRAGAAKGLSSGLTGILTAVARFLHPVWEVHLLQANAPSQPIATEWQRLADQLHLIMNFITENEHKLQSGGSDVHNAGTNGLQTRAQSDHPSLRDVHEFVKVCKEVCALMAIMTRNGLGMLVDSLGAQVLQPSEIFKDAVCKLAPPSDYNGVRNSGFRESFPIRTHLKNVMDALIEQGTMADGNGVGQTRFGSQVDMSEDLHSAMRDGLIRDIEEQCPTILQPSETCKMRARKSLVYAREAMHRFGDRSRMMMSVREGKDLYERVSRELDVDDVQHMCDGFIALSEHLSALEVLLKRCSERPSLEDKEALQLQSLVVLISQLPDRNVLTRALSMCLEHRGLYTSKVTGKPNGEAREVEDTPTIDYVLRAVIRTADYVTLWPILRKLPLLRRQSDAQQRLVEFLKSYREYEKLVDLYLEIGQYVRAQETCDQQARLPYQREQARPSLDNRMHWFRQAAKAASMSANAVKQKDFDFLADLCDVQKRLCENMVIAPRDGDVPDNVLRSEPNLEREKEQLLAKIMSPQELFNTAINWCCWEVALEVMEVLHGAGSIQPDFPSVVGRLWKLLLERAWSVDGSIDDKWANVQLTLMDVGRRYADKPDLLPLNELVEWLEKQVDQHAQAAGAQTLSEMRVQHLLRDMELDKLKLIRVYTQLHDAALRDRARHGKYFRTLIFLYDTYLKEAIQADGSVPLPLAALETDLNRLEMRNPNGAAELSQVRNTFQRLRQRSHNRW